MLWTFQKCSILSDIFCRRSCILLCWDRVDALWENFFSLRKKTGHCGRMWNTPCLYVKNMLSTPKAASGGCRKCWRHGLWEFLPDAVGKRCFPPGVGRFDTCRKFLCGQEKSASAARLSTNLITSCGKVVEHLRISAEIRWIIP